MSKRNASSPDPDRSWRAETWQAFTTLWKAYHWPTKLLMLVFVLLCVWGAYLAGWTDKVLPGWAFPSDEVLRALGSDAVRALVTLGAGLAVLLATYREITRGTLSGDAHYDVGRATAYGYLRNFLVIALLVAEREDGRVEVFRPDTIEELKDFVERVWPHIGEHLKVERRDLDPGAQYASVMRGMRRTAMMVYTEGRQPGDKPVFFDPPTTLMVIHDYYASRNQRLQDEGRAILNDSQLRRFQTAQINSFFLQLSELVNQSKAERALKDFGIDAERLKRLGKRLDFVKLATLKSRWKLGEGLNFTDDLSG
jgi:hypothetical protein